MTSPIDAPAIPWYNHSMTKSVKIAVSLPKEVFLGAESLRRRTKKSRSALYAAALKAYLKADEILAMEERYVAGYKAHPEDPKEMEAWTKLSSEALGPAEDW